MKSFSELFGSWVEENDFSDEVIVANIKVNWSDIVGKVIANHTLKVDVLLPKVYLKLDNSSLKHYIEFEREHIIEKINEYSKKELIKELILL
jgi:hypothetical protein